MADHSDPTMEHTMAAMMVVSSAAYLVEIPAGLLADCLAEWSGA